jgi:hypothetical protein
MSETEFMQEIEEARARTTTIHVLDQDWKVTPFHCVVGPIDARTWIAIGRGWGDGAVDLGKTRGVVLSANDFCYVTERKRLIEEQRAIWQTWAYAFYTNDPLIVNEMKLGEVSLAVVEDGKIVLTNFLDLHDVIGHIKIFNPGEWWLNYAEGGAERRLRFGEIKK